MQIKITKLASGYNTSSLPGQIFKTQDQLVKEATRRFQEEDEDLDFHFPKFNRDPREMGVYYSAEDYDADHPEGDEGDIEEFFDEEDEDSRDMFADPHGNSALRAETKSNPRIYPCPTCGAQGVLTLKDQQLGYQCDSCANAAEQGF